MSIAAIPPSAGPAATGSSQAAAAGATRTSDTSAAGAPQATIPQDAQAATVRAAAQGAVARQGGLAPLLADLAQAVQSTAIPAQVRVVLQQVLALATPTDPPPSAADLQQAASSSGLFLEAQLAAGTPPATPDLKTALLAAQQALKTWLAGQPAPALGSSASQAAPPYRDGPTTAQAVVQSQILAGADPAAVGHRLLAETGAALARQQLLQIASLPGGHGGGGHAHAAAPAARWHFEIPLQTAQGLAVAQFKISRDGGGGAGPEAREPIWRAGFSIDLEPMGPVHAQVALSGARANVTLWAERPASADQLRGQAAALTQGLQGADFAPEIAVHAGAPPQPQASAGQFVDQAS